MFDRYARAGRSLQVQTKGDYWAGRAALGAGPVPDRDRLFPARRGLSRPLLRSARARAAGPRRSRRRRQRCRNIRRPRSSAQRSTAGGLSRRFASSDSKAARPSRRCSSRRSHIRSTPMSTAISRSSSAQQTRPPGPAGLGRPNGADQGLAASTCARPIRCSRRRSRAACGRWPTASAGRKARSTLMRSAMPARAA